mgnify:CR=1 FL=1
MSENRTVQLVVQAMYCAFGLVAVVGSFGMFEARFDASFYTKFTNLSNYLCLGIMVAELVQTARKRNDSYVGFLASAEVRRDAGHCLRRHLVLLLNAVVTPLSRMLRPSCHGRIHGCRLMRVFSI